MVTEKSKTMDIGHNSIGNTDAVGIQQKGHKWSGWPGAHCLRCGASHALEMALAEGWIDFPDYNLEVWKSEDHRALVNLCDGSCYADMNTDEVVKFKDKIKTLRDQLGV